MRVSRIPCELFRGGHCGSIGRLEQALRHYSAWGNPAMGRMCGTRHNCHMYIPQHLSVTDPALARIDRVVPRAG